MSQEDLAPSGKRARVAANIAAIQLSHELAAAERRATPAEQAVLARWASWGAVPEVFDETNEGWAAERATLRELLPERAWDQARRTTINAHFTDPAYATQMWATLQELGFTGGTVLEPGAGAGTFIGLAPDTATMTGVELDETTAAIAAAVYPEATIRAESFADTRIPEDFFDATIGNVPFGNVQLHDPVHNRGGHSLHNHFILKSLALTRPGGLVAVLTSSFTMDAQNPAARREMNAMADLVGAVRLPSGAHRRAAGTEVVTDLLIFRRRDVGEPPVSQLWETVTAREIDGERVRINSYFDYRPQNILGTLSVGTGMYGSATLHVTADLTDTPEQLGQALAGVVADARNQGLLMAARTEQSAQRLAAYRPADPDLWDGTILTGPAGRFDVVLGHQREPFAVPKSAAVELRVLLQLRDQGKALLELEAGTVEDSDDIVTARTTLSDTYAAYVQKYGPINRFTLRDTGRFDEDGEPTKARITPAAPRLMRGDPFGPLVMAMELFDEETETATPAAMLRQRVVSRRPITQGAETPLEAIALSLDRHGAVRLDTIAYMLGISEPEARDALGTFVYDDPSSGELVHAPDYLSGDVRDKLDAARQAAVEDPARFQTNVDALERALPEALTMEEITPAMGAVWIDESTHQQFLREILKDPQLRVENPLPGQWKVKGVRRSIAATEEWGTSRRPATVIAEAIMAQKEQRVEDVIEHGDTTRTVVNATETLAAEEKAQALQERFAEWVWEDPARAAHLTTEYNRRFNSIVLRDYSTEGDYLSLPGMALSFTPRPHQRAAVARMVAEPSVGLFHQVGAGKTAEMVIGAMELVRMGLVSKPTIVVPNHMLEQFTREWLQIYPQARLLAASSNDLAGEKRRMFVARAAANDWDGIIMTRTAFERIPVSPDVEADYMRREVNLIQEALQRAEGDDRMTVKQLEKRLARLEEDQKKKLDRPRDPGITFESTGIDYLIIDELHDFKNLATTSNIAGAAILGSGRATDLHMKLEYLRGKHGDRVITGATATPIANSVTEAHVMQRYLRPDLLERAGVLNFDAWAATFGQTVSEMEMAPTGGTNFRLKTRFAKFQNVPEMLRMWHVFADVKTAEDLNLPTPDIMMREDGKRLPITHVLPPSREMEQFIESIADRADMVASRQVSPDEDNMLNIATDGRKAALDLRMVGRSGPATKLDAVAEEVFATWQRTRHNRYLDPLTGDPSPTPGGLQLVFSDLGTPNKERWDAYTELKQQLMERGMPADLIRFIHEARNDKEKARLFASAKAGHIAVLVGSTGKMGVGTNVQARVTALHHIDCPWRPADVEQRDGRGVRQGNQNAEIAIHRYVVERSFDAYMWQTVERKAKFISQIMRGRLDVREMEDIGDAALSAAETKALSSGNPLLLEQSIAKDQVAKLQRLSRAHDRSQTNLAFHCSAANESAEAAERELVTLRAALQEHREPDEDFRIVVAGERYDKRTDAADAIGRWAESRYVGSIPSYVNRDLGAFATLNGHTLTARAHSVLGQLDIRVEIAGVPSAAISNSRDAFVNPGYGLVTRLENLTQSLPRLVRDAETRITDARATAEEATARIGKPFKDAETLVQAEARLHSIDHQLQEMLTATDRRQDTPAPATPAASPFPDPLAPKFDSARTTHPNVRTQAPEM